MIDYMTNSYNSIKPKREAGFTLRCQIGLFLSVAPFQNLVTDWVEGETAFPNAFHPITPSTTVIVCEYLHNKFCKRVCPTDLNIYFNF